MQLRSVWVERALKSFAFSVALFGVWGWVAFRKGKSLASRPDAVEAAWLAYNALIALLFLARKRPSIVSMDPFHWLVALATSFSGFFFRTYGVDEGYWHGHMGDVLILIGLACSIVVGLNLGRSYDFLPALRGVQNHGAYRVVRHPMYASSIVIRGGYLCRHPSLYNLAAFLIMLGLYVLRANFEESVMMHDSQYRTYVERVRWKFLPGLY